ncbi:MULTISPECIES: transcription elongation factor GreA [unclassified Fusibacter]|uniref:transcription elongation factor GreA n=1 Tax=unclassified Fusibacter TaxID=2624464 RepID=UPI0010104252|nr:MULTISPECIES: transcription elongation factor GreA [unclassified Fusibacter]MCK8059551.1 transcription elongation factor GreA [Fusibacter sp. A2]NPE20985.1 transcription elongation factor GreA [Fusibacter sp. A1]RXV62260.1 transcription elongation factor GreA [Fusibacter sp. A1]
MGNKSVVLTHEGFNKVEQELELLKTVRRKEVAEKIKHARAFGDISENSEYDEAKNEQAELEARILKLENIIRNAHVIDESEIDMEHVSVGTVVKVFDFEFDEEVEYTIVGATEADPFNFKVSNESPIGEALIGKGIGETVEIVVPDGVTKLKILEIHR